MKYFAVIDTNVLVSALLTKNIEAATFKVMNYLFSDVLIPCCIKWLGARFPSDNRKPAALSFRSVCCFTGRNDSDY